MVDRRVSYLYKLWLIEHFGVLQALIRPFQWKLVKRAMISSRTLFLDYWTAIVAHEHYARTCLQL